MDRGLLSRQLCRRAFGRLGLDNRRLQSPCPPRRFLVRRSRGTPHGLPPQGHRWLPEPQRRLPGGEDADPLILIPFTEDVAVVSITAVEDAEVVMVDTLSDRTEEERP